MSSQLFVDQALACRLERAEAAANARFVEARARITPDSGAQWIEVAGAYAMFDGPRSPCTQTFGLGLFGAPTAADMDTLERFFRDRHAPVLHEVCPIAGKTLLPMLNERGYRPIELSSVMFLPLDGRAPESVAGTEALQVRVVAESERELWVRTAAEGWREFTEIADLMQDLMWVSAWRDAATSFLVEMQGRAIAAGSLAIHEGVALLAGASTIPEWRHCGAQNLLLESRVQYSKNAGCDLAMMCAEPGSASQRNAERHGFRIAYTRTKFGLTDSPPQ